MGVVSGYSRRRRFNWFSRPDFSSEPTFAPDDTPSFQHALDPDLHEAMGKILEADDQNSVEDLF